MLDVGADAGDDECRLAEVLFERGYTRATHLTYLARAARRFLSRRAWRRDAGAHREFGAPVPLGSLVGTDV